MAGNGTTAPVDPSVAAPLRPSDPASTDPVNILLVDDQPANLLALEAMLQGLGQNLIKADSGREALKWLLSHDFAVILLDVKMPEMDGFETAAMIRERDKSRDTPIIFLTAGDKGHTDAVRGYAVGAVDYLVKPVVPEIVRSKVAVFVELAKRTEQLRRQTDLLRRSEQEARELAEARAELVADLEHKNRELESFSYAVSHDLRAPLRRIEGFSRAVVESQGERLEPEGRHYLERVGEASRQMGQLIDDVLYLARVSRAELRQHQVDLSAVAGAVIERLRETEPAREVDVRIRPEMIVVGDGQLLRIVLENLLDNAWKFTAREPGPRIEFGQTQVAGEPTYFVRDNGAGFDMAYVDKLFTPFQRLHLASEFPGLGRGARHGAAHHSPARRPGVGGGPHRTRRHLPLHDRSAAGLNPASRERPPCRRPPVPLSEYRVGGAARSAGAPAPPSGARLVAGRGGPRAVQPSRFDRAPVGDAAGSGTAPRDRARLLPVRARPELQARGDGLIRSGCSPSSSSSAPSSTRTARPAPDRAHPWRIRHPTRAGWSWTSAVAGTRRMAHTAATSPPATASMAQLQSSSAPQPPAVAASAGPKPSTIAGSRAVAR